MNNPLPEIFISEFLYEHLVEGAISTKQPNAPLDFVERFRQWIRNNKSPTDFFGADRPPRGDFIWHVHIAPTHVPYLHARWMSTLAEGRAPTSNGSIIYASDRLARKHFLIAQFVHPTGHSLWERDDEDAVEARQTFSSWAKDFYTFSGDSKYALSYRFLSEDRKRIEAEILDDEFEEKSGTNDS